MFVLEIFVFVLREIILIFIDLSFPGVKYFVYARYGYKMWKGDGYFDLRSFAGI